MKSTGIIIVTAAAFVVAGALIVLWSQQQRPESTPKGLGVIKLTDENFEKEVVEASRHRPILVDFYADWCLPCRFLDPILEEVAKEKAGRAVIGKVDSDRNLIARRFGIQRVPAIFIIRDGEIKNHFQGVVSKDTIIKALEEYGA